MDSVYIGDLSNTGHPRHKGSANARNPLADNFSRDVRGISVCVLEELVMTAPQFPPRLWASGNLHPLSNCGSPWMASPIKVQFDTHEFISIAEHEHLLLAERRRAQVLFEAFEAHLSTMEAINQNMGYQFTQPLMAARARLAEYEGEK